MVLSKYISGNYGIILHNKKNVKQEGHDGPVMLTWAS